MIMKKIEENSHFELVKSDDLKKYGDRIIQIDSDVRYRIDGYGDYLCEVADFDEVSGDSLGEN